MGFIKKFILSCLVFILLAFSFVPYVNAQEGSWYNASFPEWYTKVYDSPESEIFGERYTAAQVQWIVYGISSYLLNLFVSPNLTLCLMNGDLGNCADELRDLISLSNQGSVGSRLSNGKDHDLPEKDFFAGYLSTNKLSGFGYFLNRARELNLIPEARAQEGFGFTQLQNPVLSLWRATRNIAYAIFVVGVVVISFMIMFRVKISPQTVISVQSALPKIAITLVLITFSYAIAGLLIDLTYVLIGFVAALFVNTPNLFEKMVWRDLFDYLTKGPFDIGALGILAQYSSVAISSYLSVAFQVLLSSSFLAGIILLVLGLIIPILLPIVIIILMIRVLWLLLKTYVGIILGIIFAPLQLALGVVVPGLGFGSWLRSLAANLAIYPIVATLFVISFIFLAGAAGPLISQMINISQEGAGSIFGTNSFFPFRFNPELFQGQQPWDPPLTLGTGSLQPLLFLGVSFVIVALIPKVADIIKGMIERKPFSYGTAVGEAVGTPARYGGLAIGYGIERGIVPGGWLQRRGLEPIGRYTLRAGRLLGVFPKE